jgi:hypothetical protein
MTTIHVLLLGILPAGLLVWAGNLVRTLTTSKRDATHKLLLLSGTLALFLVILMTVICVDDPAAFPVRAFYSLLVVLLPAMCGTLAARLLCFFSNRSIRSRNTIQVLSIFVTALVVATAVKGGMVVTLPGFILLNALLIATVWRIVSWAGKWYPALYALQVILLGVSIRATDTYSPVLETPVWLASLATMAVNFVIPALAIAAAARLLLMSQANDRSIHWRKVLLNLSLCASLLFLVDYKIMLVSMWDVATDGVGGPSSLFLLSIPGIAAAMILAQSLPGMRRVIAWAFAVIVPLSILRAQDVGSYGPAGQWGMMPTVVTERRAETVNGAIQRYYARNGEYPQVLNDLTPWYLVYIPTPLMVPGQTWCYEGGPDYYRLGYVYRQSFFSPATVRIHAVVGEPPAAGWTCQDEAVKYPASPPGYTGP